MAVERYNRGAEMITRVRTRSAVFAAAVSAIATLAMTPSRVAYAQTAPAPAPPPADAPAPGPAAGSASAPASTSVDAPATREAGTGSASLMTDPAALPSDLPPSQVAAPIGGAYGAGETPLTPEWVERDRDLQESTAINGGVGLLHMQHAQGGSPGQFRLGFNTEYFSASNLCTSDFPCQNPNGTGKITSDSLDHIGGTLSLSATVLSWLEGYASISALANSDAANKPELLQILGDTNFGLKAFGHLNKWLYVGGAFELWLINGSGSVGLDGGGTSAKFRGLATADLRNLSKPLPLRFSTNLTYSLDNTGDVISDVETARGAPITRIERFGLGIDRVDHFDIALGVEGFFLDQRIRPFFEWNISAPINRQGYVCPPVSADGDKCLGNDAIAPSKVTLGSRFLPWKNGFSLLAAFDIGTGGVNDFIQEVAPTPPWTLYIGAGWAIDVKDRPPVEKIKPYVVAPPPRAKIAGIVHETEKPDPVALAIVRFDNHPELPMIATEDDGHFISPELAPGDYVLSIRAEGYKPDQTCAVKVPEGVQEVHADCALEAMPRTGSIVGVVRDEGTRVPVSNASVTVKDSAQKEHINKVDGEGSFKATDVAPGAASVIVDAEGYMASVQPIDVKPRVTGTVEILLHKRGASTLVRVGAKEIFIKQQVQFQNDSAVILPASNGLLTEIADVLLSNPRIHQLEVQGHTDNRGSAPHNQTLSEDRANAVKTWLVQHGVAADRLVAKGYGQTRPMAPNVTERNRASNRRVQFIITQQDAAQPKKKPVGKTPAGLQPFPF